MNVAPAHPPAIRSVVVVGGGTAGWIAAAVLAHSLGPSGHSVTLVESDAIGTVGVGEATIPHLRGLHALLGIDEDEFVRATQATFKLGIEFVGWSRPGARYTHPFGVFGAPLDGVAFHHHWLRQCALGGEGAAPLAHYSLAWRAADAGRFQRAAGPANSPLGQLAHAFHFDAVLCAAFLRRVAEAKGARRVQGRVVDVARADDGRIASVLLEDGRAVAGDLFVDCSGFAGLLIEGALGAGYQDWSHWLPCDSAVALGSGRDVVPEPRTRATAHGAGWQWRIPLRHRTGNGRVYASAHLSDAAARTELLDSLDGPPLGEPRQLRFTTGRRRAFWSNNCVALGLAAGFLEPLESTSIHLAQSGALRLAALFPRDRIDPAVIATYNRVTGQEWAGVRDFLIAHYHCTSRDDTPFWRHVRSMSVPDSLAERMALWRASGQIVLRDGELFGEANWLALFDGQEVPAQSWSPLADALPAVDLDRRMANIRQVIAASRDRMPCHQDTLDALSPPALSGACP